MVENDDKHTHDNPFPPIEGFGEPKEEKKVDPEAAANEEVKQEVDAEANKEGEEQALSNLVRQRTVFADSLSQEQATQSLQLLRLQSET